MKHSSTKQAKAKCKFRSSSKWKKLRDKLKKQRKLDELTMKPLRAGWNLHHLDMSESHYEDISNESHFSCLNRQSHECIHFLFRYYKDDHSILLRLKDILDRMERLN